MSIMLYVGGSKDGEKGVVPYGFTKSMAMTEAGQEVYVQRQLALQTGSQIRVMALDSLDDDLVMQRVERHYAG